MFAFFANFSDFCFWCGFYFGPSARGTGLLA
jgi:hypothetical protein